ncbi:ABC-type bacteriocin/lantibiotic exporter, contains an N-terminal double-glycine peptidase domain [Catalinimonas alkaloidigena]|uniref:ABC-type bacteriocin/lantibiotic exporter, contains an N-terminal double-glycine peptidase domain n=1 Tax=Catalinimonas alkaloidigena TaxID=1075417 RepID=A0A1G9AWX7_9BACT|nr:ABC transporter ATP-binding protein [Catalinimonas alkaloidigena]SDK31115.1 ABC-type bacteriocin/lantibiotic exporter, contains an N-terminal double-glycine peptidase domain [Catalinimonas alkaloidigena]
MIETAIHRLVELVRQEEAPAIEKPALSPTCDVHSLESLIAGLAERAEQVSLRILRHHIPRTLFRQHVVRADFPVVAFVQEGERWAPVIFTHDKETQAFQYTDIGEMPRAVDAELLRNLHADDHDQVLYLAVFAHETLVSEEDASGVAKVLKPVQRFYRMLKAERRDITYIYIYAIAAGLITLSLPLGIQAIIGLISGGLVFNSVVVLISLVIVGVFLSGALQVMQLTLVEILQRRLFAKAAFEFSYRVPRVKLEAWNGHHPPELMNRFFDVVTVQKGLPKVLIELTAAALQILFGLVLLAFYHPFFVFFGLALLLYLFLIFYFTGTKGLETSLTESKYKYRIAYWLQELARNVTTFKLTGRSNLALQKTDHLLDGYLRYRKKHFKVLLTQFINIVTFKTIITGSLLVLGTLLVVDRQITLGQFVASEVIIVLILGAVEKTILSMETIYDTLTGVEKIAQVTDLPLERLNGIGLPSSKQDTTPGLQLQVRKLRYTEEHQHEVLLDNLSFDLQPGERLALAGFDSSGKEALLRILAGVQTHFEGDVRFDGVSARDVYLPDLRHYVSKNVSRDDLFNGTLLENITLGKPQISYQDVRWAMSQTRLDEEVGALPEGLETELLPGGRNLPPAVASRIMLARCIVSRPRLLILNDFLQALDRRSKQEMIAMLTDSRHPWSLLCVSNDPTVLAACDRVLILHEGALVAEGTYEALHQQQNPFLQQL